MAKLFVVGDFNIDLVLYLDRLPRAGETLNAKRFLEGPGGKGSNQAIAAARLGADVTFFGAIGVDYYGSVAERTWAADGVNTSHLRKDAAYQTAMALINVDVDGNNTIAVHQGANLQLSPADVDGAADAIAEADMLMCTLGVPLDVVARACEIAHERGVRVLLNPAPAVELPVSLVAHVDYLTPNETELAVMLGGDSVGEPDALARQLLQRDDQTIIITQGAAGARWITRTDSAQVPTFTVDVVDTVGAGDAFNAGLAVALSEGKPLAEAMRFANATAALSVQTVGAVAGMPARAAVDAMLAP